MDRDSPSVCRTSATPKPMSLQRVELNPSAAGWQPRRRVFLNQPHDRRNLLHHGVRAIDTTIDPITAEGCPRLCGSGAMAESRKSVAASRAWRPISTARARPPAEIGARGTRAPRRARRRCRSGCGRAPWRVHRRVGIAHQRLHSELLPDDADDADRDGDREAGVALDIEPLAFDQQAQLLGECRALLDVRLGQDQHRGPRPGFLSCSSRITIGHRIEAIGRSISCLDEPICDSLDQGTGDRWTSEARSGRQIGPYGHQDDVWQDRVRVVGH